MHFQFIDEKQIWIQEINKLLFNILKNPDNVNNNDNNIKIFKFSSITTQEIKRPNAFNLIEEMKQNESETNNSLFLNRYYPTRQIAFGPFGHIIIAQDMLKTKDVILQLVENTNLNPVVKKSIDIIKDFKCEYCLKLIEHGHTHSITYAVYSCNILMKLSDLIMLLPNKRMNESLAVKFAIQLLDVMSYVNFEHYLFL